eukprot:4810300-Amphidinium_carterae.1
MASTTFFDEERFDLYQQLLAILLVVVHVLLCKAPSDGRHNRAHCASKRSEYEMMMMMKMMKMMKMIDD